MIAFTTATGSVYTVDDENKTWARPENPESTGVRTTSGSFLDRTEIAIGKRVLFVCPPLEGGDVRIVHTTHVVSIQEVANA